VSGSAPENKLVLLLVGDPEVRDHVAGLLTAAGFRLASAESSDQALDIVESRQVDAAVVGLDSLSTDLLGDLRRKAPALPLLVLADAARIPEAVQALRDGAEDYLLLPPDPFELKARLGRILERHDLDSRIALLQDELYKNYGFKTLVRNSPAMRAVLERMLRVAPMRATVLISGESGVGKELVARAIHYNSPRRDSPFVAINCAAIAPGLIESELFGHEKGSFTGATEKQVGKFEQADRGTIFLDEVGDMSAKTQAKVLRVLQEGEVERLGSARTIKVDVRVIAATNKNLEEEIEKGHFREDLYFRLAVIPIFVPPLRERPGDISLLVRYYIEQLSRENNTRPKRITQAALDALQRYRWKGNIRELRNTVERLIIMSAGDAIDVSDLPDILRSPGGAPAKAGSDSEAAKAGTLREFKDVSERAYLVSKLRENSWNISKTAEVIDTPRSNLYKKLEQYQISQETDG
jgi:two-component system nitrogen regulation response regulator NtrX